MCTCTPYTHKVTYLQVYCDTNLPYSTLELVSTPSRLSESIVPPSLDPLHLQTVPNQ